MKSQKYILAAFICLTAALTVSQADAQIGRRFPSEMSTYNDPVTGIPVKVLTNSPEFSDSRIYQTHPQWTWDNKWIAFRSARSGAGQLFFVNEQTGEIVQVTDGQGNGEYNLSRKRGLLYFMRRPRPEQGQPQQPARIIELDTDAVLQDSERGDMKPYTEYERVVCVWPDSLSVSGGMGLDVAEDMLYIGITPPAPEGWVSKIPDLSRIPNRPGGIRSVNVHTGEIGFVFNVDFTMGHVQASPFVTREIVFCHETGGDSPQRMWYGDMTNNTYRPLYIESEGEWVTHETIATKDHVYFNVLSHLDRLRGKPSGIFSVNLRNGDVRVLGQVIAPEYGPEYAEEFATKPGAEFSGSLSFWHCNGSIDGRWAVGDDFAGNISLINVRTGQNRLLTTGHRMRPDHAHPYFSSDSRRLLLQSGALSDGKRLALMVIDIPDQWR
jgi:oligogalacturonide lyase